MTFSEIKWQLKDKCVGIAGCGGLGSNCAVALARTGIGKLIIVDFDTIDESNLNRQYFFYDQIGMKKVAAIQLNIARINPATKVIAIPQKINSTNITKLFGSCDIIVEAFDLAEQKKMLIETILEELPHIPIISGNGMAGWGDNNLFRTEYYENLIVCGDFTNEISSQKPPLAPKVGIVAHLEANAVLEVLLKNNF